MWRPPDGFRALLGCFGLALALISSAAAAGAQLGRWVPRLDLLTHGAMVWVLGGLVGLILAVADVSPWRRACAAVLALVAVAASVALMVPDYTRARSPFAAADAPCQIKIVSFNAWGGRADARQAAAWIAAQRPTLVVVIEPTEDLRRSIAAATGLQTWMGDGAMMANATGPLSNLRSWSTRFMPGAPGQVMWDHVEVLPRLPVAVLGIHTSWPVPARTGWARDVRMGAVLDTEDRASTIMLGDFNSTQWSFRQQRADALFGLERRDRALLTWPARVPRLGGLPFPFPLMPIDHVYAGADWRTVSIERGPRLGSDHYPIVTRLAWAKPADPNARGPACRP